MTNRDPNTTEFERKFIEYYDCLANYFSLSNEKKLKEDLNRQDIDLVCFYELKVLKDHFRTSRGLNYNDFNLLNPSEEKEFKTRLGLH